MRNLFSALFGTSIRIGLSKTGIAVLRTGGRHKEPEMLVDLLLTENATLAPERLAQQCAKILTEAHCSGLPLTVTLSDEWARLFMVTPPQNAGSMQDIVAAAAMRFQGLYGESPNDWQLDADWHAHQPFLACALPRTLLNALQQVARESKLHVLSVLPQFVAAWNNWSYNLQPGSWFGVVQEEVLTLGAIAKDPQQRLSAVQAIPIPHDGHSPSWVQEQVKRSALRLNLPAPSQLQLCGNRHHYWDTAGAKRADDTLVVSRIDKSIQAANTIARPPTSLSAAVLLARSGMRV